MSKQLAIDNSQVRTFQKCQKEYLFRHVWDLTPGLEPWLLTGSAWGAAMDVVWKSEEGPSETIAAAIAAFEEVIASRIDELSDEGSEDWRIVNRHHYHEALAEYLSQYQDLIRETFDPAKTECEIPFEVPLPLPGTDETFFLTGRMDKIVWNIAEESWWVVEHKTTGMWLGDAYMRQWSNSGQVRTYGFVGRKRWGSEFGGILVDCTSVAKKGKIAMQMLPITLPPLAGGEWEKDMREIALAIAARRAGQARYVKSSDACERFGRICCYFEPCGIDYDPRQDPASWGFRVEHWDPRDVT